MVGVAWAPGGVGMAFGDTTLWCRGDGVDAVRRVLEDIGPRLTVMMGVAPPVEV